MLPRLFHWVFGDWTLHVGGYGFPAFCGVAAALVPALRRAREAGLPRRPFLAAVLLALLGGLAGAKLAAWLQTGTWSGRVLYGGLLGGLAALVAAARALRLPAARTADVLTPPMLLAAAFGRLGCLLGGCCYGVPWEHGLAYPQGSLAWKAHALAGLLPAGATASLPTLPMPLLEATVLFVLAVATSRVAAGAGRVLAAAGMAYAAWRFVAEFGRGDHAPWAGAFTFSQWISAVVLIAAAARLARTPAPARAVARREPFRWSACAQVAALLLMAALGSGGLGCGGRAREADDKAREYHGRGRDKAKEYYRRAKDEVVDSCADDCARMCCELTCAATCDDEDEDDGPPLPADFQPETGRPAPPPSAGRFHLPVLKPGERVAFTLDLQGRLNYRTSFSLRMDGFVEALPHEPAAVPYRLSLARLEADLGTLRLKAGPGEADLRLDAQGIVTLGACTLGDETLRVLKAVEDLVPGLVQLPALTPAPDWQAALERELSARDGQAYGTAKLGWSGSKHGFEVRAWITVRPDGTRRVQWLVR